MIQEATETPPEEGTNSAQPHEAMDATRADYEGWWERAADLHKYMAKVPSDVTDKVGMSDSRKKLVDSFDQLALPGDLSEPVPQGDVKRITSWIDHAEGFVGFLLQSYKPAPPTTPAPVLAKRLEQDEDWRWPWIDGWEDPKKRKKILKPSGKEDSQVKKLLIGGAVLGGALLIGKKFMETE
jgi:hypothetical protein